MTPESVLGYEPRSVMVDAGSLNQFLPPEEMRTERREWNFKLNMPGREIIGDVAVLSYHTATGLELIVKAPAAVARRRCD
jgi:hypothetical protein